MAEQRPERPVRKSNRPGGPNNGSGMRFGRGLFGWILFIGLAIMLIALFQMKGKTYFTISLSEFKTHLDNDKVQTLLIDGDEVTGEFRQNVSVVGGPPQVVRAFKTSLTQGVSQCWAFK